MGWLVKSDFVTPSETFRAQLAFRIQASLNLPDSNPCLESKTEQSVAKAQNYIEVGDSEQKQAQLRLCKLGPGTVLIFYKSLAPTPIYM